MKMKTKVLLPLTLLVSGALFAADSTPKDEVTAAAKKLGDRDNYSWKTTVAVPESAQFKPGPTEGKTQKDGLTWVSMTFGDNTSETYVKGDKAALSSPDGGWQSLADAEKEEGPGRFRAMFARNLKTPDKQASEAAGSAKELKKDGDVISGDLTEEGAKKLLTFGRRGGGEGPTVSNASGSVKFWVKDGVLGKYEIKVKGTVSFNGNEREADRTTTVEIKDVGTTKIEPPADAKKKLE
jgi:hypothetical protein